jgi:hypothetical protein
MKHPIHLRKHSVLLACCLAAVFSGVQAAETNTTPTSTAPTATTAVGTSATTEAKLTAEFSGFLGGEAQASSVVSGLRQGTAFDLVTETTTTDPTTNVTSTTTTTTTIDPPTGTMGYGNVRIALRLAQAELNQLGITEATPEQLSAMLLGGDINGTQVNGILTMRAEGMGWGQIAQQYGTTVGQIMGKGAAQASQTAASAQTKNTKTSGTASSASSVSTAKPNPASQARSNGYIPSGKASGAGIVTGMGGSIGSNGNGGSKGQTAKASPQGNGVMSAGAQSASQHASAAGIGNAGGANAMAPGQVKKN